MSGNSGGRRKSIRNERKNAEEKKVARAAGIELTGGAAPGREAGVSRSRRPDGPLVRTDGFTRGSPTAGIDLGAVSSAAEGHSAGMRVDNGGGALRPNVVGNGASNGRGIPDLQLRQPTAAAAPTLVPRSGLPGRGTSGHIGPVDPSAVGTENPLHQEQITMNPMWGHGEQVSNTAAAVDPEDNRVPKPWYKRWYTGVAVALGLGGASAALGVKLSSTDDKTQAGPPDVPPGNSTVSASSEPAPTGAPVPSSPPSASASAIVSAAPPSASSNVSAAPSSSPASDSATRTPVPSPIPESASASITATGTSSVTGTGTGTGTSSATGTGTGTGTGTSSATGTGTGTGTSSASASPTPTTSTIARVLNVVMGGNFSTQSLPTNSTVNPLGTDYADASIAVNAINAGNVSSVFVEANSDASNCVALSGAMSFHGEDALTNANAFIAELEATTGGGFSCRLTETNLDVQVTVETSEGLSNTIEARYPMILSNMRAILFDIGRDMAVLGGLKYLSDMLVETYYPAVEEGKDDPDATKRNVLTHTLDAASKAGFLHVLKNIPLVQSVPTAIASEAAAALVEEAIVYAGVKRESGQIVAGGAKAAVMAVMANPGADPFTIATNALMVTAAQGLGRKSPAMTTQILATVPAIVSMASAIGYKVYNPDAEHSTADAIIQTSAIALVSPASRVAGWMFSQAAKLGRAFSSAPAEPAAAAVVMGAGHPDPEVGVDPSPAK